MTLEYVCPNYTVENLVHAIISEILLLQRVTMTDIFGKGILPLYVYGL